MTDPINLTQLREAATFDSVAQGAATMIVQQDVLLALIDVVTAAQELMLNPHSSIPELGALAKALARFDFGDVPSNSEYVLVDIAGNRFPIVDARLNSSEDYTTE